MNTESGTLGPSFLQGLQPLEEGMTHLKGFVALLRTVYGQCRPRPSGNSWERMFMTQLASRATEQCARY